MRCWDADFRGFSCGFTLSRTTSLLMAWPPFTPRRGDVKNFQRPRVLWLGRDCPYHWRRTSLGDLKLGPGWVMWWVVWEVFFLVETPVGALKMMLYIWGSNKEFGSKKGVCSGQYCDLDKTLDFIQDLLRRHDASSVLILQRVMWMQPCHRHSGTTGWHLWIFPRSQHGEFIGCAGHGRSRCRGCPFVGWDRD